MRFQTLRIDVTPEPLEWFDNDDARPQRLRMDIEANGQRYGFIELLRPDFFESDFEQVMDMVKRRVRDDIINKVKVNAA